jgi:hypothetical protein
MKNETYRSGHTSRSHPSVNSGLATQTSFDIFLVSASAFFEAATFIAAVLSAALTSPPFAQQVDGHPLLQLVLQRDDIS